jgi:hypothetical protein
MLTTDFKSKLPRKLSYPIGAEALSNALANAPFAEKLRLSFHTPNMSHSQFMQILDRRQPYVILLAEYRPQLSPGYSGANFMMDAGWYEARWELIVYPVLKEQRRLANVVLNEDGLPFVRQWLGSSHEEGWLSRHQSIELIFDQAGGRITTNVENSC